MKIWNEEDKERTLKLVDKLTTKLNTANDKIKMFETIRDAQARRIMELREEIKDLTNKQG